MLEDDLADVNGSFQESRCYLLKRRVLRKRERSSVGRSCDHVVVQWGVGVTKIDIDKRLVPARKQRA